MALALLIAIWLRFDFFIFIRQARPAACFNSSVMASISPELDLQIQQNPAEIYAVLITLNGSCLPESLKGKGQFVLADKIFSAKLSGVEIRGLIHDVMVDAIEADTEMHML